MSGVKISDPLVSNPTTGKILRPAVVVGSTNKYRIQDNLSANADPTINDDSSAGYGFGSVWFRQDTRRAWRCSDASVGAAVWTNFSQQPSLIAGRWWNPMGPSAFKANAAAISANTQQNYFGPFTVPHRLTVSDIGTAVNSGVASSNCQFAIYSSGADGYPAALLGNTGNISTAAGGALSGALGANVTLEPGLYYWLALQCSSASVTFYGERQEQSRMQGTVGFAALSDAIKASALENSTLIQTGITFGTWPNPSAAIGSLAIGSSTQQPAARLKITSIP